ncbi:MAG: AbrB/MazE/SpoVT family DNA-binding domain-containing protein [Nitrosarchaeum sp.]|nr:AbrB/MazE/SpoVT family DNA-binding domain-containing protein [Nitrosarchaeum sp.]
MQNIILTISSQGQITIPQEWRDQLQLKKGTKLLAWIDEKIKTKVLIITPQPASWVKMVLGTGKGLWGKSSDDYIQNIRNQWK